MTVGAALRRILGGQEAAELPVLDSSDTPRFPSHADLPADAPTLRALAEQALADVERRRAGLPDDATVASAAKRLAGLRERLASATLMHKERIDTDAHARSLDTAIGMYRLVVERLGEVERQARAALARANALLSVDKDIEAAGKRITAADAARTAAQAEAERFGTALAKAEQDMQALADVLAAAGGAYHDMRADQATGAEVDAARLAELRERMEHAQRAVDEQGALLAAIERRATAAHAAVEKAGADHAEARADLQRLEKLREERDAQQAAVAVAALLRERMPHGGDWRAVLNRAATELARG